MLKVGVFGAGHLGKFHLQQWLTIPGTELIGFFDPSDQNAAEATEKFGLKRYTDASQLIDEAHIIDIVTPTLNHFTIAKEAILKYKHVFIEKPMTHTIEEAHELVKLVEEANVKCQIGHVERYNPAYQSIKDMDLQPMFIESHRLAEFNPRGTDVSVILDLMIHDIDIILHLVKSPVRKIVASGVAVVSPTPDIANVRIDFDNGCVANLTASRISLKKMRKMRLFQKDAYIGIDFLSKKTEVVRLAQHNETVNNGIVLPIDLGDNNANKSMQIEYPTVYESNAIQSELADFVLSIVTNSKETVPVYDGLQSMEIAYKIIEKISGSSYIESN